MSRLERTKDAGRKVVGVLATEVIMLVVCVVLAAGIVAVVAIAS